MGRPPFRTTHGLAAAPPLLSIEASTAEAHVSLTKRVRDGPRLERHWMLTRREPSLRAGALILLVLALLGCRHTIARAESSSAPFSQRDSTAIVTTIRAAWAAGAARDTSRVFTLTHGVQARRWLMARGSNGYFENSVLDMSTLSVRATDENPDAVQVRVRSSFVSCPRPFHQGVPDVYTILLRRIEGNWRIEEIGIPIC